LPGIPARFTRGQSAVYNAGWEEKRVSHWGHRGGELFIESSSPLTLGTELSLEFALPDRPAETLKAKAKVAWVRHKPERYLLFPGMGVHSWRSTRRRSVCLWSSSRH
jgi:hypothetical protein